MARSRSAAAADSHSHTACVPQAAAAAAAADTDASLFSSYLYFVPFKVNLKQLLGSVLLLLFFFSQFLSETTFWDRGSHGEA